MYLSYLYELREALRRDERGPADAPPKRHGAHMGWWVAMVLLSGLCSGVTGLYTGSYMSDQRNAIVIQKQAERHERELMAVNERTDQVASAVASLSAKIKSVTLDVNQVKGDVSNVQGQVDSVASTVGVVRGKVKQAQTVGEQALATAKLSNAKAEVAVAKAAKK